MRVGPRVVTDPSSALSGPFSPQAGRRAELAYARVVVFTSTLALMALE